MADQEATSTHTNPSQPPSGQQSTDLVIPPQLKFLISNIKNLIPHALTADNYAIWRIQVLQQFTANGYAGHLTGASPSPADATSPEALRWHLEDNNLLSALFSTISPSILPYIITATTAQEVWQVLERRLQPTCRSRVIQLKNELHHVQMKNLTMQQYLSQIKTIVDSIAASGSRVDPEDIIIHILNELPSSYNPFKAAIRTYPIQFDLDNLYSMLCSEEINVTQEHAKDSITEAGSTALYTTSSTFQKGRSQKRYFKSKNQQTSQNSAILVSVQPPTVNTIRPTCQICGKPGHIAINCWHRCNFKYAPTTTRSTQAYTVQTNPNNSSEWILDTGATSHLTPDIHNIQHPNSYTSPDSVSIANGSSIPIQNSGQGLLPLPDTPHKLYLRKLLHVPKLAHNLLSVSKLTSDNPISIRFDANGFVIKDTQDRRPLLRGNLHNGLYKISQQQNNKHVALHASPRTTQLWHNRLGHPHRQILSVLSRVIPDIQNTASLSPCISCSVAKSHKISFNKTISITTQPFELIHTDIWGPAPIPSLDGFRYYALFTDDFTRFSWIYLMHNKQETFSKFKILYKLIKTQFQTTPKILRSDGGGEFLSNDFTSFLQHHGIQRQLSCPHTPEQNGVAERKHRHLLELTRTLIHASNTPHIFWAEALSTANYLINRLPSKSINFHTPFQRLHKRPPNYTFLRTFGCLCFPWLRPYTSTKLDPRSQECVFLGYSTSHKGYKCYNLKTHKIHISRHVVFHEEIFPYKTEPPKSNSDSSVPPIPISPYLLTPTSTIPSQSHKPDTTLPTVPNQIPITTTTSQNVQYNSLAPETTSPAPTAPPPHRPSHPMTTRLKSGISKPKQIFSLVSNSSMQDTPKTFKQAMMQPHWQKAMQEEFEALQKQQTWILVPPPNDKPILGCKWTYKTKTLPDGKLDRYKARLVALGYDQQLGINYTKTFSPVAKMTTIRILLTLAVHRKWSILQLDISNAFLHGDLHEDVYMRQPPGFADTISPTAVCKLQKSLYGLKQAPRQWFEKLTQFLLARGFRFSRSDPSLLIFTIQNIQIFFLIYVDDILVTGNDSQAIQALLKDLRTTFALKQLGDIALFLGIQTIRTPEGFFLTQHHYAEKILKEFNFMDCKPAPTPSIIKSKQQPPDLQLLPDSATYRRIAGSLQYLSITRPDIAFATNQICQHMHQPTNSDLQALKRLLRYLKGTLNYGLPIQTGDLSLRTYTDADWASDIADRKSISGYCTFLGSTLISWTVKKQVTVAKSSTEAEYRALSAATSNVLWIRRLLDEVGIPQQQPTTIHCDNISAMALAKNPVFHARTKHIEIDYHFIRQHLNSGAIQLSYIASSDNISDIFTKSFSPAGFQELRRKLTIQDQND
ncbi:Retrovirus-related Pol polyprotein from transposon TNT 1-94 [Dendrobium catenatum]|uniref:Retrovirus-related Pol polyprotein from transposon TNT 1-94 n=1 Tax=Dendrobium catenatum TaxID=906689 RepID=A0A2I0X708_9ASPA|nr:Retrovirus-related Pol polyprotein from transposon TNT 1-94 [Dendrobium catenatum]